MSIDSSALLIIDVQQGFDFPGWGERNNPEAEENILAILNHWREKSRRIIHVQHCSLEPNSPPREGQKGHLFKPEAQPLENEAIFRKTVNSAFIRTGLENFLREKGIEELVIVGLTTDHCVSTTTRMAANLGFKVYLVQDATATFERKGPSGEHFSAQQMHETALASLHQEFASIVSTAHVLQSLLI